MHCSMETPPDPKLQPFFGWLANAKDLGQMEIEHDQVYAYAAEVSGHILIESWL